MGFLGESFIGAVTDNPWIIFIKKLQLLESNLKKWNSNNRDSVFYKKKNLQDMIESIDGRLMGEDVSDSLREQEVFLLKEMSDIDPITQLELDQKVKLQWDIEGDENWGYFHGVINRKRHQIVICGLMIDKLGVDNPVQVK